MSRKHKNWKDWIRIRLNELGFSSYAEYLRSPHWQALRKRFYRSRLYEGGCYCCARKDSLLQIHHRSYRRLGREFLGDLVAVCGVCHKDTHELLKRGYGGVNILNAAKKIRNRHRRRQARFSTHNDNNMGRRNPAHNDPNRDRPTNKIVALFHSDMDRNSGRYRSTPNTPSCPNACGNAG